MYCYGRTPSPFVEFRWDLVKAAIAFDNLRLAKEKVDRQAIEKVISHMRQFAGDTSKKKDPRWVVYYSDVFTSGNESISVVELQKIVGDKADEMSKAVADPSTCVPMRMFCLHMHEQAR